MSAQLDKVLERLIDITKCEGKTPGKQMAIEYLEPHINVFREKLRTMGPAIYFTGENELED
jgi:hypothetical protein